MEQPPVEYTALLKVFCAERRQILEIEIVPSSISPPPGAMILVDGNCIGIPKKVLVKAFHFATRQFSGTFKNTTCQDDAFLSTFVILLFDPEHLTAANYRKRRLQRTAQHFPWLLHQQINEEFIYLDTVLTSPLHRQTKSPTLWYHRWWLLSGLLPRIQPQTDVLVRLISELSVILRSGERHRNNYYAFQHGRRVLSLAKSSIGVPDLLSEAMARQVLPWCLEHPSDTSAWTFLHFVLARDTVDDLRSEESLQMVLRFVDSTQWRREALWVFLRACCVTKGLLSDDTRQNVMQRFDNLAPDISTSRLQAAGLSQETPWTSRQLVTGIP